MKKETLSVPKAKKVTAQTVSNQQKVMQLFDYFGKGNVPAIIEMCSDDCDWKHGGDGNVIPFAKPYKGKKGVGQFFQSIGQSISVSNILPSNFKVSGNEVSHDFHVEATVKDTGKSYVADVLYMWTFDNQGKICKHRSPGNYSAVEAAFRS
jgi:ketosteroid isomerase-like protein